MEHAGPEGGMNTEVTALWVVVGLCMGGAQRGGVFCGPECCGVLSDIPLQNTTLQLKKEPQDLFIQAREMFFLAAWGGRTTASFRALMARDRPIIQRTLRRHRFPAPHVHAQKPAGTPIYGQSKIRETLQLQ